MDDAGIAQLSFHIPVMIKKGAIIRFSNPFKDKKVKKILLLMLPIALGAAITQFNVVIDKFLAMHVGSWAPAALTYSERLIYLPLGIIATAFGTVLLPSFSEKASKKDLIGISNTLINSIGFIFYLMIPAFIGLFILAEPIIETIFKWNWSPGPTIYSSLLTGESIINGSLILLCFEISLLLFFSFAACF